MQSLFDHAHVSPVTRLIRSEGFDPDPASIRGVRRLIQNCCLAIGLDPDDPTLLASELATNAVRHAQTPFKVTFVVMEGRPPWIEVLDWSLEPPRPRPAGPDDLGGRGFELIDELAARWHTDLNKAGGYKIVCVTLKGDQNDDSGHEHHGNSAVTEGQHAPSTGQPDHHRGDPRRAPAQAQPA
ncbi:ATP-binding protein [Kitasatospora sp. NPDC059800]|uniref:ATP-binding protein n=1 Tax=Kitasatospora sp. NPDC059800 TaxID=3346951 RepID=UPI003669C46E